MIRSFFFLNIKWNTGDIRINNPYALNKEYRRVLKWLQTITVANP